MTINKWLTYIPISIIVISIIILSLSFANVMSVAHVSVKELAEDPTKYKDKAIIVNGIITQIYNSVVIHTLWDDNRMIVLNIPPELEQQVITNINVEVRGIFRVTDEDHWLDVKEIKRL